MVSPLRGEEADREVRSEPSGGDRTRPRTVAFAASRDQLSLRLSSHIYGKLLELPPGSTVLLRRPRTHGQPGLVEQLISRLVENLPLNVRWFEPGEGGRGATYERDYAMVEAADYVEAYFGGDKIMEGGTGHVVEAAIASGVPVYAWAITEKGIERVGEWERDEPDPS